MPKGNSSPSVATRFKPGHPPSRTKQRGDRDRISRAFLLAYADEFEKSGAKVLTRLVKEDPATFAKIGAALLPKEIEHRHVLDGIDDAQLASVIEELRTVVAARVEHAEQADEAVH